MDGRVQGVAQTIATLRDIESVLRQDLPKSAQSSAGGIGGQMVAAFPREVVGFTEKDKPVVYSIHPRSDVDGSDRPVRSAGDPSDQIVLYRIVISGLNATWADLGQRRFQDSRPKRDALVRLEGRYGAASRFAWRVFTRVVGKTESRVAREVEDVSRKISRDLDAQER